MTHEPTTLETLRNLIIADQYDSSEHVKCDFKFAQNHDIRACEKLASTLTHEETVLMAIGDGDERGWWLESTPHMSPLQDYLCDFFNKGLPETWTNVELPKETK